MTIQRAIQVFAVIIIWLTPATAFRIAGTEEESIPFVPYEKGFVGKVGDNDEFPTRVNQGYESISIDMGYKRLQNCPGMVGPLEDEKFYCIGKEFGYCDRRSGICFCNKGYSGAACESCDPNHHRVGSLCYQKIRCPNDCSSAGTCDHLSGTCDCNGFREGTDCSEFTCSKYHPYCTHCDEHACIHCAEGFSINKDSSGEECEHCSRFDPRCNSCNGTACLDCIDSLLLSIKRSGRRDHDPELPYDELMRELSITVPFGSLQSNSFDEAEKYYLSDPRLVPLNASSVACDQGTNSDSSFNCYPFQTSNVVCGHNGVISFLSPTYEILENASHIRLTIQRTGGGIGNANVSYAVDHISTNMSDLTSTASHTIEQTLSFDNHEVQKSFLITINDDLQKVNMIQITVKSPFYTETHH